MFLFVIVLLCFILFIALLVQGACTHSLLCILLTALFFLGFLLADILSCHDDAASLAGWLTIHDVDDTDDIEWNVFPCLAFSLSIMHVATGAAHLGGLMVWETCCISHLTHLETLPS